MSSRQLPHDNMQNLLTENPTTTCSHLWEVPSFFSEDPDRPYDFDYSVIYLTENGDAFRPWQMVALPPLAKNGLIFDTEGAEEWADLAEGNQVRAFVFSPANYKDDPPYQFRYPYEVWRLIHGLEEWVPNSQPARHAYYQDMVNEEEKDTLWAMDNTARGKVLVQYTPAQRVAKEMREVDGRMVECDIPISALRVFNGELGQV